MTPLVSGAINRHHDLEQTGVYAQVTSDHYELRFSSWTGQIDSLKRMWGCTLLCRLPEGMLDDALHSLQGQLEFYEEDLTLEVAEPTVIASEGYAVAFDDEADDPASW